MKNDIVADLVSSLSDSMQMQGEYADILQEMKSENAFLLEIVEENGIPLTAYETHAGDSDFGNGFYLGTKERQTLFRVSNEANLFEYKFSISLIDDIVYTVKEQNRRNKPCQSLTIPQKPATF